MLSAISWPTVRVSGGSGGGSGCRAPAFRVLATLGTVSAERERKAKGAVNSALHFDDSRSGRLSR
jgi:hypothetical protein